MLLFRVDGILLRWVGLLFGILRLRIAFGRRLRLGISRLLAGGDIGHGLSWRFLACGRFMVLDQGKNYDDILAPAYVYRPRGGEVWASKGKGRDEEGTN